MLSIQYHFSPAGNMIFCRSEPSRGLCVSNHQKRLKPGSNKNLYARSNFRSIISDSCTLKILDGEAWTQTCSERRTLVQQPWKTDPAANQEPLISLCPLSFLYADLFFLMITRSRWGSAIRHFCAEMSVAKNTTPKHKSVLLSHPLVIPS